MSRSKLTWWLLSSVSVRRAPLRELGWRFDVSSLAYSCCVSMIGEICPLTSLPSSSASISVGASAWLPWAYLMTSGLMTGFSGIVSQKTPSGALASSTVRPPISKAGERGSAWASVSRST